MKTSTYGYILNIEHQTRKETKFRNILRTKQKAKSDKFSNTHGKKMNGWCMCASECEKCEMEEEKL